MTSINYGYSVRGLLPGPRNEKPKVIGAKFLQTLDALSGIDPLFTGWQLTGRWQIPEEQRSSFVPLADARKCIAEIVERGVDLDDFNRPHPEYGYGVIAVTGPRGSRHIGLTVSTTHQSFELSFGEYNIASDLSIVTYPLFKAALLAISTVWNARWAYARASRKGFVEVRIDFGGVPAFRIDSASDVPSDPTFPKSVFRVPWISYLSAQHAAGVTLSREILTEHTPDGGLLMTATEDRLDPTNPEHVRRARILAETLIACTGD
jgi:hypothetical protein